MVAKNHSDRLARLENGGVPEHQAVVLYTDEGDLAEQLANLRATGRSAPGYGHLCIPVPMSPAEWEIACAEQQARRPWESTP
jgi:hypothetical protein